MSHFRLHPILFCVLFYIITKYNMFKPTERHVKRKTIPRMQGVYNWMIDGEEVRDDGDADKFCSVEMSK